MQVSSGNWTHPAAAAAALSSVQLNKESSPPTSSPTAEIIVTDVESAKKPGDRDADETYLPQDRGNPGAGKEPEGETAPVEAAKAYTDLPADDGESHQLDCWG